MAFKRSAVRSRLAPPNSLCTSNIRHGPPSGGFRCSGPVSTIRSALCAGSRIRPAIVAPAVSNTGRDRSDGPPARPRTRGANTRTLQIFPRLRGIAAEHTAPNPAVSAEWDRSRLRPRAPVAQSQQTSPSANRRPPCCAARSRSRRVCSTRHCRGWRRSARRGRASSLEPFPFRWNRLLSVTVTHFQC
jgi:hypothetical protein